MSAESELREAAARFGAAFVAAKAAGLVVIWPKSPEGLAGIEISQTGAVAEPVPADDHIEVAVIGKAEPVRFKAKPTPKS